MDILKIFFGIIGFIAPGWLLSRVFNSKGFESFGATFIISSISVYYAVFFTAYSGISANFATVLFFLFSLSLLFYFKLKAKKYALFDMDETDFLNFDFFSIFALAIFAFLLFLRAFFQPMMSPDSVFRWNHMAELIFRRGDLNFYPPLTIEDFLIYPYPDAFPFFVSAQYAFLYFMLGKIQPAASSIIVFLLYIFSAYYTGKSAEIISGNHRSGQFAIFAFLLSPYLFFSFLLGQESGWTALSAAGFFYHALKMRGAEGKTDLLMCAIFAAAGGLTREYGLMFVMLIVPVLFFLKISKQRIIQCLLIALAIVTPFYLRSLIIFKNPFYPLSFFGLLAHNLVYEGILSEYSKEFFLFSRIENIKSALFTVLSGLIFQAAAILIGMKKRFLLPLNIYIITIFILWAISTKYTCGGIYYSMRVLSPAIIAASIIFGVIFSEWLNKFKSKHNLALFIFLPFLLLSLFFSSTVPKRTYNLRDWFGAAFSKKTGIEDMIFKYIATLPEGSMILSDSALYQAHLYRKSNREIMLAPVWAQEFIFLFDENISFTDKTLKLRDLGITHIMQTIDTHNNKFFERFSFFREYPGKYSEIIRGPDSRIFILPSD